MLAKAGTGVSHCPGTGHPGRLPHPPHQGQMQEMGVCVSLGCDGSATNDSSNLLDSHAHCVSDAGLPQQAAGRLCISSYEMLKIATVNGAKTLGRNDLGSLEPEKGSRPVYGGRRGAGTHRYPPRSQKPAGPHWRHRKRVG